MSLELFHEVPAGVIETLFDEQNQPLFKRADLGIFINLDGSIKMIVRSKKPKAVALVKWLTKKGVEKIQEEHQQAITDHDNQIQALESTNERHQQKILRLNEDH